MNLEKKKSIVVVAMEGVDGVGKTTHVKRLISGLRSNGLRVSDVKFPRETWFLGRLIRSWLVSGKALVHRDTFQLLQWLDRFTFQVFVWPFLRAKFDVLIIDRWKASSLAFGVASSVSPWLVNFCTYTLKDPTLTLLLGGKSKRSEPQDVYERTKVIQVVANLNYTLWACIQKEVYDVNTDAPVEVVAENILNKVLEKGMKT